MRKEIDLIGQVFGRLTVITKGETDKHRNRLWECQCECGNTVKLTTGRLRHKSNPTKSCGCLLGEQHGLTESKEYVCWQHIKQRCLNPKDESYQDYGDRGITIYVKWKDSFTAFLKGVGKAPGPQYSLDRIDNEKGYEPGNTRWVLDRSIQRINQRIPKTNKSGVRGVHWSKTNNKWVAQITIKRKRKHLGSFADKEEAINARKLAEEQYHNPLLKTV